MFGVLKLNELLSPAGTVTAPDGADESGLVGSPLSHQVTGGDDGVAVDAGAEDVEPGADAGAELRVEVGARVGVAEPVAGAVSPEFPAVGVAESGFVAPGDVGVPLAAVDGAVRRATVAAAGSDEGVRLHFPAVTVPSCPESVARATWACAELFTVACRCAPAGAAATAPRPDEPRPNTTRSLPGTVTDGDVLEDEVARASTGVLWSTPAKAIVTAAI
jgi:hypothetical protein